MMRRLLAVQLIFVLLAPWMTALNGAAAPLVPCPMHRARAATGHDHATAATGAQHESAQHQRGSHQGRSGRGCNCAGECGRSSVAFSLPAEELVPVRSHAVTEAS